MTDLKIIILSIFVIWIAVLGLIFTVISKTDWNEAFYETGVLIGNIGNGIKDSKNDQ